jgi:membrane protease YdiL (CAAX protease family)
MALAVWLLAWLPLGLWQGDPDYVLTEVSRGTLQRQIYQGLLYTGLLLVCLDAWRRHAPPRPAWGRPRDFGLYAVLGLLAALSLRALLQAGGARQAPAFHPAAKTLLVTLLSALAVALVEEALFRGFLLGTLARGLGPWRAALASSALFTAAHLFRPGTAGFKAAYAAGLFLLALLLARVAWQRSSLAASAGLHAGIIWPNLLDPWTGLAQSWWSGWQQEPASGAVAWMLTALLWAQWEWWERKGRALWHLSRRGRREGISLEGCSLGEPGKT